VVRLPPDSDQPRAGSTQRQDRQSLLWGHNSGHSSHGRLSFFNEWRAQKPIDD